MPAEPVQHQHRHMRLAAPRVFKFRAKGDDEQHGQPRYSIECQVEQLARGWIDPMRILENHQDSPASRQGFELMQQGFKQLLAFTLRAEIEIGSRTRQ
jgi:hypothetical protein